MQLGVQRRGIRQWMRGMQRPGPSAPHVRATSTQEVFSWASRQAQLRLPDALQLRERFQ
ncbi:TilS substrate-binding domain-containing protein [Streptomyces sp. NPDC056341]|uniref:TilS substrate-binding domain-containing protein n=1 Tax=Streptomyces sp. NPDC056341 TaxID=3345788 RepID=UPI0035DBE367